MIQPASTMKRKTHTEGTDAKAAAAFTLTELLVVVAVLAILALTVLPALGRAQPHSRAALCQRNLKQLAAAWQMYAEDYSGRIVANFGGGYRPAANEQAGWVTGWLDWSTAPDNTNVLFLTTPRYAALSPYLNGASHLFKCPADDYLSSSQRARGWSQRVRSYSVNAYVGENTPPGPSGPGGSAIYKQTRKISEFRFPMPAEVAVFIDEHPDSRNDPIFWSPNSGENLPDFPAAYHNGAAVVAFADGHAAEHKWKGSLTTGSAARVTYLGRNNHRAPAGDQDLSWLSFHTPRVSTNSF